MPETDAPAAVPADLSSVIHAPKRLAAMAILNAVAEAEFAFIRSRLDIADSDLSKQMTALVNAELVQVRKTGAGRAGKTWFSVTPTGRQAFEDYRASLQAIVGQVDLASPEPD